MNRSVIAGTQVVFSRCLRSHQWVVDLRLLYLIEMFHISQVPGKKMSSILFCVSPCISFKESGYILDCILQPGQNTPCTNRAFVSMAL